MTSVAQRQPSECSQSVRRSCWRGLRLGLFVLFAIETGCQRAEAVSTDERRVIADSLQGLVVAAHDFAKEGVVDRLIALYPDSGRVISASGGRVATRRDTLVSAIGGFWQNVGQNMVNPKFVMGSVYVDVITRNAAVMTFTYSIPHTTPAGHPHTVSGAWTALWRRQDGRWKIVQEHLSDTPESTAPLPALPDSAPRAADSHEMSGHVMPKGGRN